MNAKLKILDMCVDVGQRQGTVERIFHWVDQQRNQPTGYYVCVANVHMCMEAYDDAEFRKVVNNADFVVADGRPLVWAQKSLGAVDAEQIRGMDLMLAICQLAEKSGIAVGFYGGAGSTLEKLTANLRQDYPRLAINCTISPPFRELSAEEDQHFIDEINRSGIDILFVGLGCPKQERWMAAHKESIHCVMLGVGAAFDFIAGDKRHAPIWMQTVGLEWFYRLISEPRRLWKRYLKHNPRFVGLFLLQWLKHRNTRTQDI